MKLSGFLGLLCSILLMVNEASAKTALCQSKGAITSVKKVKSGRTEYLIFTINKPAGYKASMTTLRNPNEMSEGGDANTVVKGCKYKKIKFNSVYWTCQIAEDFSAATTCIEGVKRLEQFEGVVSYMLAYSCKQNPKIQFYWYAVSKTQIKYVVRVKY